MYFLNPKYNGQERRQSNGMKPCFTPGEWLTVVIVVVAIIAWGLRVEMISAANAKDIETVEKVDEEKNKKDSKQDTDIAVIQNDVKTIKDNVQDISTRQQAQTGLLIKIATKLNVEIDD